MTLGDVVAKHRVVVCVGSGGVGKTTAAAAVGLWGAYQGRASVVITIDPARRLASALGLEVPSGAPHEIPADRLGERPPRGSMAAMMLDQKGAWDRLVERHAPNPRVRDQVLANAFYQNLSQTFAGSYEYMAIEELAELHESRRYDLIVVDTPPTKHALDFLEAPRRLDDFLDRRIIRWFVRPYMSATWIGMRLMNRTIGFLLKRLEDATGLSVLLTISEFFTAMSGLFDGFHERVERAYGILQGAETAFILITTPDEQVLGEAEYLSAKMAALRMPLKGVIVNRTHDACPLPDGARTDGGRPGGRRYVERVVVRALCGAGGSCEAHEVGALVDNFMRYQALGDGESLRIEAFVAALRGAVPAVRVPNFAHDVHDIGGLAELHPHLFSSGGG
jgi:anion-transporting  ArsA/GET3 family ATPase